MRTSALTGSRPRISYEVQGAAGPPVLLIMGFSMSAAVWERQVEGLRGDHRVARFDNRGVAGSEATAGPWRMRDLAGDAIRVLDDLGWDGAHVAGVSMGGMVAQELALRWPDRVRSLTLIATHAGGTGSALPTAEGLRHFVDANRGRGRARVAALQRLLYPESYLARCDREALTREMLSVVGAPAPTPTRLRQLGAVMGHRTRGRLGRIRCPTLVVRPDRDVLVRPSHSDVLHRGIPGARLVSYEAGHGLIFQCAAELNDELRRHVRAVEPISSAA